MLRHKYGGIDLIYLTLLYIESASFGSLSRYFINFLYRNKFHRKESLSKPRVR